MDYDADFYAWTQRQAVALRNGVACAGEIDWERVAEEIEDLGRSQRAALDSMLIRIIEHLLKLEFSPAADPRRGWEESVSAHRVQARRLLKANPSLKGKIDLADVYADARVLAAKSLSLHDGLGAAVLPETEPYSLAQVLDVDWLPPPRAL